MLSVAWTEEALDDLAEIIAYISDRNPIAAQHIRSVVVGATERLPTHPYVHRPGRVHGTREAVVHPNYIVVYRVGAATIDILTILHARQQYP